MLKIYNSLTRKVEAFEPLNPPKVTLYTCGPTVYDYTHIGHLKKYVGDDILRRILEINGYEVKEVMNITDVGHLVSDEDAGEDKMEKGAREKGLDIWQLARFYEDYFLKSIQEVNIEYPNYVTRATEHINQQIKLIEKLVEKGYTYQTPQAIYFDVSKFKNYGKLSGQNLEEQKEGARSDVVTDKEKKHSQDFALWFFTVGRFGGHTMKWSSPWGQGFPGWHIECSAMSMHYLGSTLDIHTGGLEHIPVHHTNEIAQSEAATGKQFVRFWVHHNFLIVDGEKMSKSKKNFYTIDDIKEKRFDPLALRYLFLTSKYRDKLNFTWESLSGAQKALNNLREEIRAYQSPTNLDKEIWQKFMEAANNDLNIPQALAVLWEIIHKDIPTSIKAATILEMDKVLGLKLSDYLGKLLEVPIEVQKLVEEREKSRATKDFKKADQFRKEIEKLGYEVEDTIEGPRIKRTEYSV